MAGGASTKVIPRAAVVFHPNFAIALDMVQALDVSVFVVYLRWKGFESHSIGSLSLDLW